MPYYKHSLKQDDSPVSHTGLVVSYNSIRGQGNIRELDSGQEYYFTRDDLKCHRIESGCRVLFALHKYRNHLQAVDIVRIG